MARSADAASIGRKRAFASAIGYPPHVSIERVELKNFTVFADATFELTSGVNVFIGRNSTGKTHAMKALYALLRAAASTEEPFSTSVGHQLREVFKPDDDALGRLG